MSLGYIFGKAGVLLGPSCPWHSKKVVWSLSPVPGTELLKQWEFPECQECLVICKEPFLIIPAFMLMR